MATRKLKTVHFWRGELPHWQVEDGRYFVTIHLRGSIPPEGQRRIRLLGKQYRSVSSDIGDKQDEALGLSRRIFAEMERWLDQTPPTHHLGRRDFAEMLTEAIHNRCERRIWDMFRSVIMPSHIHLFFELNGELSLKHELEEFKRWTGHRATQLDDQLRGKRFWQTEWFDHWSRSDEEDERIVRYIRQNPVKAGLAQDADDWPYTWPQ